MDLYLYALRRILTNYFLDECMAIILLFRQIKTIWYRIITTNYALIIINETRINDENATILILTTTTTITATIIIIRPKSTVFTRTRTTTNAIDPISLGPILKTIIVIIIK